MFDKKTFTYKAFTEYVMKELKLDTLEESRKETYKKELMRVLGHRILASTINAMNDDNLAKLDAIMREHPELSYMRAIDLLLEEIPLVHELVIKNVNDLADELIYDAEKLDDPLKSNRK